MQSTNQIQNFLTFLGTGPGLIALLVFIILLLLPIFVRWTIWPVLSVLLWAATLTPAVEPGFDNVLSAPIEQIRNQGRGITIACLLILLLPSLLTLTVATWRRRTVSPAAMAYFAFQLALSGVLVVSGNAERGAPDVAIYVITFIVLGVGVSRSLTSLENLETLVKVIVGAIALFVAAILYEIPTHRAAMVYSGRFLGTTGNANHAGMYLAIGILPTCYLITSKTATRKSRIFAAVLISILVLLLMWTGSRTGLVVAAVGIVFMYRTRLSRAAIMLIVAGVSCLIAWSFLGADDVLNGHLVDTSNSRLGVWTSLWQQFLSHPILGSLISGANFGVGENSYLATAGGYGLLGLIPLLLVLWLSFRHLFRLWGYRKTLGHYSALADLVIGGTIAIFVGGVFEGILLGTLTMSVYVLYLYFAMAIALIDLAQNFAMKPAAEELYDYNQSYDPVYGGYYG